MTDKTITIEITIDQANLMLEGLGLLPFVRVYALIAELQEQAKRQLGAPAPRPSSALTVEAHGE